MSRLILAIIGLILILSGLGFGFYTRAMAGSERAAAGLFLSIVMLLLGGALSVLSVKS